MFKKTSLVLTTALLLLAGQIQAQKIGLSAKKPNGQSIAHGWEGVGIVKLCDDFNLPKLPFLIGIPIGKELVIDWLIFKTPPDGPDIAFVYIPGLLVYFFGLEDRVEFSPIISVAYIDHGQFSFETSFMKFELSKRTFLKHEINWSRDRVDWGTSLCVYIYKNIFIGAGADVTKVVAKNWFIHGKGILRFKGLIGWRFNNFGNPFN